MTDIQGLFIEEKLLNSVKKLLAGRVNEVLGEGAFLIPPVEFTHKPNGGYYAVTPELGISACERSEKERIIRLDAYSVTVSFSVPDSPESESHCYAYAAAVDKALREDTTLGGAASRALLTGKKYVPPKHEHCGDGWELVLSLRLTVEDGSYAG